MIINDILVTRHPLWEASEYEKDTDVRFQRMKNNHESESNPNCNLPHFYFAPLASGVGTIVHITQSGKSPLPMWKRRKCQWKNGPHNHRLTWIKEHMFSCNWSMTKCTHGRLIFHPFFFFSFSFSNGGGKKIFNHRILWSERKWWSSPLIIWTPLSNNCLFFHSWCLSSSFKLEDLFTQKTTWVEKRKALNLRLLLHLPLVYQPHLCNINCVRMQTQSLSPPPF